jgi:hypothetical protein
MPHPAKIAFTLLSHVADEKDIGGRFERCPLQRSGNRQKSRYTCCVVADPRPIDGWLPRAFGARYPEEKQYPDVR